jgi:hypothetical protein
MSSWKLVQTAKAGEDFALKAALTKTFKTPAELHAKRFDLLLDGEWPV